MGGPADYSVVVFDNNEFEENNATATLFFGNPFIKERQEDEGWFYSQAFFSNVESLYVWNAISDMPDEDRFSIAQQIDELPLESTAKNIFLENVIYLVHHETDEGIYLSGEYGIEQTYADMRLESIYFNHSQRVKIPSELFTEDVGVISFIYYTMSFESPTRCFYQNGQKLNIGYEKKSGKIHLEKKVFYSGLLEMRSAKVLNLEK